MILHWSDYWLAVFLTNMQRLHVTMNFIYINKVEVENAQILKQEKILHHAKVTLSTCASLVD